MEHIEDYKFVRRVIGNKKNSTLEHMEGLGRLISLYKSKHGAIDQYYFLQMYATDLWGGHCLFSLKDKV